MNSPFFKTVLVDGNYHHTCGNNIWTKPKNVSKTEDCTMAVYYLYFPVESPLRQRQIIETITVLFKSSPPFEKIHNPTSKKHPDLGQCTTQSSPVGSPSFETHCSTFRHASPRSLTFFRPGRRSPFITTR